MRLQSRLDVECTFFCFGSDLLLLSVFAFLSAALSFYTDGFRRPAPLRRACSRKEVFQPHLPVRLPCYDLAPVTGFALGRSCYGHALQAPPAPMA